METTEKSMAETEKLLITQSDKDTMKEMKTEMAVYVAEMKKVMGTIASGAINDPAAGNATIAQVKDSIHKMEADAETLDNEANKRIAQAEVNMTAFSKRIVLILTSLVLVALAVSIVVSFLITRSITVPLVAGVGVANRLAEGDLTMNVEVPSKDETGQLLMAMKNMVERLREIVLDVKTASDNVASGSRQ